MPLPLPLQPPPLEPQLLISGLRCGGVCSQRTTCDEWIGPGTYDPPGATIGTENIHTGSCTGMFDRYVYIPFT
jgi:hypothetical protein